MSTTEHLLVIATNGDTFYIGPLEAGERLARRDRHVIEKPRDDGGVTVLLSDSESEDDTAEWGSGLSHDEAMRYALGALFGPMDDEYDEALLWRNIRDEGDGNE